MRCGSFDFDPDVNLPVSGTTPAARHASASGAQAVAPKVGTQCWTVLQAFRRYGRLTIAEAARVTGIKEGTICARFANLEQAGWITGTGAFEVYHASTGRRVKREYHALTARGEAAAQGATS